MSFPFECLPQQDLYQCLKAASRPIVIYGMGDGAAKLLYVLEQKGVKICGICASDDFVRGQSFMGYPVLTCQQSVDTFGEPIFLIAFASRRPEVICHIRQLSQKHRVYIPDINVYGDVGEVFDSSYLASHKEDLQQLYEALADDDSKRFLVELICYKLSGQPQYLWNLDRRRKDPRSYIPSARSYCDLGAYNGDSLLEWKALHPEMRFALAVEPNVAQFKKLSALDLGIEKICVNAAVSDHNGEDHLGGEKGRGASLLTGAIIPGVRQTKSKPVRITTLDALISENAITSLDLIKFDVEGFELRAIIGSQNTIQKLRPALVVSAYHQNKDLFCLYRECAKLLFPCKVYLSRANKCFPAWETEFTIIPDIV